VVLAVSPDVLHRIQFGDIERKILDYRTSFLITYELLTPAMTDRVFQLKWNCETGVCPRGAHVRRR
jgi:hypothetical protein